MGEFTRYYGFARSQVVVFIEVGVGSSAKKNTPYHALQDFYLADALPHQ